MILGIWNKVIWKLLMLWPEPKLKFTMWPSPWNILIQWPLLGKGWTPLHWTMAAPFLSISYITCKTVLFPTYIYYW